MDVPNLLRSLRSGAIGSFLRSINVNFHPASPFVILYKYIPVTTQEEQWKRLLTGNLT
jgi:hypothetical protein